jgi:predicted amidohydrolase
VKAAVRVACVQAEPVEIPSPAVERIGEAARRNGVWIVTGVNEVDPERPSTIYNSLLFPLRELIADADVLGRGGSAVLGPDGAYLAGPLSDEEGILYADLDPARLWEERQRFDPAGHYHRPDVLSLTATPTQ